ncbi:MAG: hypothetical protein HF975_02630 [ANME-2 cluster archaeon]|nr:hypothetical protein [ANME-2 cluster archaeon]
MKIIAASIIRNEEKYIETMIRSISWIDEIVLYNDHCSDRTIEIVNNLSLDHGLPKIFIVEPMSEKTMLSNLNNGNRDLSNEMQVRNTFLKMVFEKYNPNIVVLIDGDEMMSSSLLTHIEKILSSDNYDSIAVSCNHIFDENHSLDVYPAIWNDVRMVDPHVRVLKRFKPYEPGEYPGVPDCFLKPTTRTLCLDLPIHYHLKYIKYLGKTNYSLRFLSKDIREFVNSKNVIINRFDFPSDLKPFINKYLNY